MIWLRSPERLLGLSYEGLVERVLATHEEMAPPARGEDGPVIRIIDGGVELSLNQAGKVRRVRLFSEGREGYRRYVWPLPHGLTFQAGRDAVLAVLGQPHRSGGGQTHSLLGKAAAFDDYDLDHHRLVVEYGPGEDAISTLSLIARRHAASEGTS